MSYIKDNLLSPYYIECTGIQYIVRKEAKININSKSKSTPANKAEGYLSNKYSAYKLIARLKSEAGEDTTDLVRNMKEDNNATIDIYREFINKLEE